MRRFALRRFHTGPRRPHRPKGTTIVGRGYQDTKLGRHPNRHDLDQAWIIRSSVSAADPLVRIFDMVNRRGSNGKLYGENQGVTPAEAIRVFTLGGAFAMFEEKTRGSITAGKLADFVVLEADPTKVAPQKIKEIVVRATYIGGAEIFTKQ